MDRRTQRLEDLTIEALQEPNALRATVKAATAQLLDIGFRLGDEIKGTISTQPAKQNCARTEWERSTPSCWSTWRNSACTCSSTSNGRL